MKLRAVWVAAAAALSFVVASGRADAFPIVFDGPGGFGISAASATAAEADGVPIIEVTAIATAASLHLTIPAPDVLSFTLVGNPSVANPNRATSEWSVTNSGTGSLSDTWLIFLNPVTYTANQVGFEIDGSAGWAVITIDVSGTDYYYPARFLGDMAASDTVDFLMRHLVGQPLHQSGNTYTLPQYSVGAVTGIPVPEPVELVLVAFGLAMTAVLRRRNA